MIAGDNATWTAHLPVGMFDGEGGGMRLLGWWRRVRDGRARGDRCARPSLFASLTDG